MTKPYTRWWELNGPWQPFVIPIDTPPTSPGDGAQFGVCFNADWEPAVIGALKSLARPETWAGDDLDDLQTTVQRAQTWLDDVQDNCGLSFVDWHYSDVLEEGDFQNFDMSPTADLGTGVLVHFGLAFTALISDFTVGFEFLANSDDEIVCVHVDEFRAEVFGADNTGHFVMNWTDCEGSPNETEFDGHQAVLFNIDATSIVLTCDHNCGIAIFAHGDAL
jgi:hypothetical protein